MKKLYKIFSLLILILIFLTACESADTVTISRIMANDNWIYYTNIKEGALYKMRADMSEKSLVSDISDYMVIQDDAIYFLNDDNNIGRIDSEGENYKLILDFEGENHLGFQVVGDWIYYALKTGEIYKVTTDGQDKTKLATIAAFNGNFAASEDWIFYVDDADIYRMQTDGSEIAPLATQQELFDVVDDWVYYGEVNDKNEQETIYQMKSDGSEAVKLTNSSFSMIDDEWVYYIQDDWLHRIALDGSNTEKLADADKLFNLALIEGDYMYVIEYSGAAYRANLDGSNKVVIE